jgi:hypothetical protein
MEFYQVHNVDRGAGGVADLRVWPLLIGPRGLEPAVTFPSSTDKLTVSAAIVDVPERDTR